MILQQAKIVIFYGTDTGNTQEVAEKIAAYFLEIHIKIDIHNIIDADIHTFYQYDLLIFGIPTWDFGGIQEDWEELEDELSELDLSQSKVAIYGLGDQFGYGDFFIDAVGWLYEKLLPTGANFIGKWPTLGYEFDASRACIENDQEFCGLALDEDQQFDLSDIRIQQWISKITNEFESIS
ncbi:flavodoxin [Marinicellulosiphila megalodicopiae]|uniref:flavodoxin n=1 Tax=Marinicellulosiphila megalodicopiae TaxID=2724896 RepID=UPI003BB091D0